MASSDTTLEANASPAAAARPLVQALRVAVKGALLLVSVFAAALGIALGVPEANDYALAARIQHRQLTAPVAQKIVLVGGSNLAFGIDSPAIEAATGCHVANMGINGYLGVRYMLAQVEPHVTAGDIVVLAFEYDSFFKSVEGTPSDQLVVVKANPVTLSYYTPAQKLLMLKAVPFVAQQKILRLMGDSYDRVFNGAGDEPALIHLIETAAGVTRHGDLVSHLGVEWPYDREDGLDATTLPLDGEIIGLLQAFADRLEARGVHVVMSYTPVLRDYYDRHMASLVRLHGLLAAAVPLDPPSAPRDYVFDEGYFFDTVYHLNAEGRAIRTERLIDDLQRQLHDDAHCSVRGDGLDSEGTADD